jgi:hypothetical protein
MRKLVEVQEAKELMNEAIDWREYERRPIERTTRWTDWSETSKRAGTMS